MADRLITITDANPATGKLTMSDQGTTNVDSGDQITWVIGTPKVTAITGIANKNDPGSKDVFEKGKEPSKLTGSTSWQGTINPAMQPGDKEDYSIFWSDGSTGWHGQANGPYQFDPTIKINPKTPG